MLAFTYVYKCYQKSVLWNMNDIQFNEVSLSRNNSTVSPFKQYAFLFKQYSVLFKTAL